MFKALIYPKVIKEAQPFFLTKLVWVSLFALCAVKMNAQNKVAKIFVDNVLNQTFYPNDSISAHIAAQKQVRKLQEKEFILANLDSIVCQKDTFMFYIFKGTAIQRMFIKQWEGINDLSSRKKISIQYFNEKANDIISYWNNEGYPFAKLMLSNTSVVGNQIETDITLEKGTQVLFDSIIVFGNSKFSKSFMKHYLGIEKGAPYSEKKVAQISSKVNGLEFIRMPTAPAVFFVKGKAQVIVRVQETKANKLDAIIGFAPQSDNNSNKLLLTGQADIALVNLTGNRESFNLFWQSFLGNSQSLETKLFIPYLPFIHLGTTLAFDLTKFDSNYIQNRVFVGLNWLKNSTRWTVFYESENTSLITVDTTQIRRTRNFPTINGMQNNAYGLLLQKQNWSSNINPYSGYSLHLMAAIGTKTITKDIRIEKVEFTNSDNQKYTIYDSLALNVNQYQVAFSADYILPLFKDKWVIYHLIEGKGKVADQLFFGDLYRIGGFKTLKGFDEQSIFASQYLKTAVEVRYRINQGSNVFAFFNTMYYQNDAVNFQGIRSDVPIGFGFGANINTGNNVLSMAYGFGVQKNIPLNFSQGKFHFGLVSYF